MNLCIFTGYIASDITLENKRARISLATNEYFNKENHTTFVPLVAFDKTAEIMAEHLKKGDPVEVVCKYNTHKTDDGKYYHSFIIQKFEFGKSKKSDGTSRADKPESGGEEPNPFSDDDIPF